MPARVVDIMDYRVDLEAEVARAAEELRDGRLVVLPTETVYGIAAVPGVADARDALSKLRGDAPAATLTPHLPDADAASLYLGDDPGPTARRLLTKLWPGPVALSFAVPDDRRAAVAGEAGVDENTLFDAAGRVTLRCPDEIVTQHVLKQVGRPAILTRLGLPRGLDASRPPTPDTLPDSVTTLFVAGPTRYSRPSTVVRVDGESWDVVREGVYDRRIVDKLLRTTVLFVCSGNTCRSPMAMALARRHIAGRLNVPAAKLGDAGYEVVSAGTFAMPGMRATPQAVEAVADMGGDLASHRSQPLSVELVNRADLIVTMGRDHSSAVTSLVPSAADKTVTLDPEGDIADPIGNDAGHYRDLAGEIDRLLADRLKEGVLAGA